MTTVTGLMLEIGGQVWTEWSSVDVTRDLDDLSGSFSMMLRDADRSRAAWMAASAATIGAAAVAGAAVTISVAGTPVMTGWVDEVGSDVRDGWCALSVAGRDRTCDLVDCAATVDGPAEYRGLTLAQAVARVCAPYGIGVRDDVGLTTTWPKLSVDVGETAMSAVEKWTRQAGVLVTSDGVGGLVITRTGATRMQAVLALPGNVLGSSWRISMRERYSDYYVKGQAGGAGGSRAASVALDASADPLTSDGGGVADAVAAQVATETRGTEIAGHATDEAVGRYRPLVMMARTDATAPGAQTQAEWAMRVARARAEQIEHQAPGWLAPGTGEHWRLNSLIAVQDAYAGWSGDRLIAGVRYAAGDGQPAAATLRLVGPEAYDLEPVGERRVSRARTQRGKSGPATLDGTAEAL